MFSAGNQQDHDDTHKNCFEFSGRAVSASLFAPSGWQEWKKRSRDKPVNVSTKWPKGVTIVVPTPRWWSLGGYGDVLSQLTSQFGRCLDHRHGEIVSLWTKFATRNCKYRGLVREIVHLGGHVCKIAVPHSIHSWDPVLWLKLEESVGNFVGLRYLR